MSTKSSSVAYDDASNLAATKKFAASQEGLPNNVAGGAARPKDLTDFGVYEGGTNAPYQQRLKALQSLFDKRLSELQQRRLQPGSQTTLITGRQ